MSLSNEKRILPFCPISSNCVYWNYLHFFWGGGFMGVVDVKLWGSFYYNGAARKGNAALISSPLVHCCERHKVLFLLPLGVRGGSRIWVPGNLWILTSLRRSYGYSHQIFMPVSWSRMLNNTPRNETVSARNDVFIRHRWGKFRERVAYQSNFSSAKLEGV
jgi:hypothetical protein